MIFPKFYPLNSLASPWGHPTIPPSGATPKMLWKLWMAIRTSLEETSLFAATNLWWGQMRSQITDLFLVLTFQGTMGDSPKCWILSWDLNIYIYSLDWLGGLYKLYPHIWWENLSFPFDQSNQITLVTLTSPESPLWHKDFTSPTCDVWMGFKQKWGYQ